MKPVAEPDPCTIERSLGMNAKERVAVLVETLYSAYKNVLRGPPGDARRLTREAIQEEGRRRALRELEETKKRRGGEA